MFGLGMWEVLAILVVVIVLFGAKRIPDLAKGLGQGVRNFKKELKDGDDDKPKLG
jgi:sec-independent protein translocase protein TatA